MEFIEAIEKAIRAIIKFFQDAIDAIRNFNDENT